MIIAFKDNNGNGRPDPGQGEPIVGPVQPWGAEGPVLWYVHPGYDWLVGITTPGFHVGYNLAVLPFQASIKTVDAGGGRLELSRRIGGFASQPHTGVHFRVERDGITIIQGDDLASDATGRWVTTSADLTGVAADDVLIVTDVLPDPSWKDFSEPVGFEVP